MVAVNLGRSVGPALAGLVIAGFGVPVVFALNAFSGSSSRSSCSSGVAGRPDRNIDESASCPLFAPAAALRLARANRAAHSALRVILFITPGMVLWALLPLIASQRLGLGAAGYGALLGRSGRAPLSPLSCSGG